MTEAITIGLKDFIKFQVNQEDIIIVDCRPKTQVLTVKIDRYYVKELDKIVGMLKLRGEDIDRSKIIRQIIQGIVNYCKQRSYCAEVDEIPIIIKLKT